MSTNIEFPNKSKNTKYCVFFCEGKFICEWDEETYLELIPDVDELSIKQYQEKLKEVFLTKNFYLAHKEEVDSYHWFPKYIPDIHPNISYEKPKRTSNITIEKIKNYYELLLGSEVSVVYYIKQETTKYILE